MGYPAGGVRPVPGDEAGFVALVKAIALVPSGRRAELVEALRGGAVDGDPEKPGAGHLCVTAWVFDEDARHVLLVRHPTLGWVQPGGHLDPGERPATGAARELAEETGLAVTVEPDAVPTVLHPARFPARGPHPAHLHWNLGYRFQADSTVLLVPEEAAPVAWFPVDALPAPTTPDVAPLVALLASV